MNLNSTGFVDLRVHQANAASHSDDSVWPSFTDIMMVVVIIFLMASVIFMLRNVQLDEDLQSAELSQLEADQQVISLRERVTYLSDIIAKTQQQLTLTEQERKELSALSEQRAARIGELEYTTANLYAAQNQLTAQIEKLNEQATGYRADIERLTGRVTSMNTVISDLESLIARKTEEFETLQGNLEQRQLQLASLEDRLSQRTSEFENLEKQFQTLQSAHNQLQDFSSSQVEVIALLEEASEQDRRQIIALLEQTDLKETQIQQLIEEKGVQKATIEQLQINRTELNERVFGLTESEKQSLLQIQGQKTQIAALQSRLTEIVNEVEALQTRYEQRQQRYETVSAQLNDIRVENARLEELVANRQLQIDDLTAKFLASSQREKSQELQLNERLAELANAKNAEAVLRREIQRLENAQIEQEAHINRLLSLTEQIGENLTKRDERIEQLSGQSEQLRESRQQTLTELTQLKQLHEVRLDELTQLKQAYQSRLAELAQLHTAVADQTSHAQELQSQIVELQEENQLLLRPARSPAGRYVVEIRYRKDAQNRRIIQYRLPQSEEFVRVSRSELENTLEELKATKKEGLYTKIVFPDERNINFSEAWQFTQDILAQYDYYHQ